MESDLVGNNQHKSDDEPEGTGLQAVSVRGGVMDCKTVFRVRRRNQDIGIATPSETSEHGKDEQARGDECCNVAPPSLEQQRDDKCDRGTDGKDIAHRMGGIVRAKIWLDEHDSKH